MEVMLIRKAALRFLVRREGGNGSLAKKLKLKNGSYLSQITSQNSSRSLSEKVARKFEKQLGLPHLWMDNFDEFSIKPSVETSNRITRIFELVNTATEDQLIEIEKTLYLDLIY